MYSARRNRNTVIFQALSALYMLRVPYWQTTLGRPADLLWLTSLFETWRHLGKQATSQFES